MDAATAPRAGRRIRLWLSGAVLAALAAGAVGNTTTGTALIDVIVQGAPGAVDSVTRAVTAVGGTVEAELRLIDGVAATLPEGLVSHLEGDPAITTVTTDRPVTLNQADTTLDGQVVLVDESVALGPGGAPTLPGNLTNVVNTLGASEMHARGIDGSGVDVAVIDSGIVPVGPLAQAGRVVHGPDISFEGWQPEVATLDTYGHGTHMAGVINAVAPGARLVSVKVADATGATDVSQVIAAMQWIVEHRNANGLNIRVLNLSFGTDGGRDPATDPLVYATERVVEAGIVTVVSAGNSGTTLGRLNNPAVSPAVIAVGAVDTKGTSSVADDTVPTWTSVGNAHRAPDVVAPGRSIVSLRNPGSWIDANHPEGRVGEMHFKGSGTSQAAAAVSGAVALLLDSRPELEPHHVQGVLRSTATNIPNAAGVAVGKGLVNVPLADSYLAYKRLKAKRLTAGGGGSLDDARGSAIVTFADGSQLTGDTTWNGSTWTGSTWTGSTWTGSTWTGSTWTGGSWNGSTWTGSTWTGSTWTGSTWTGSTWTGSTWTGSTWTGSTWTGSTWTSPMWHAGSWS